MFLIQIHAFNVRKTKGNNPQTYNKIKKHFRPHILTNNFEQS